MEKSTVQYVTIEPDYAGQRIDNYLVTRLKGLPKSRVYRILRKGEVRVNKKRIDPSYRLQAGDIVRVPPMKLDVPEAPVQPTQNLVALLRERILYEDKSLLIINKPSGIAVHGGSGIRLGLVEALRSMYPELPHLELAHRLDVDTSGCLILAKNRGVLGELHTLLRDGDVRKIYLALTKGHWKSSELHVNAPLLKNHLAGGERIVRIDPEGKSSLTDFQPIETYKDSMLMEVTLHTGRTHQIRVHAQFRGHPLAGDEKYGDREFNKNMRQAGLKRIFLHSHIIEFTLPSTGQKISITAPLDKDLVACLSAL